MTMNKEMVLAAINKVDSIKSDATDDEILELGLKVATMNWQPEALEWLARKWSYMDDEEFDLDEVAGNIQDWQLGYRCEQEDQPTLMLAWAVGQGCTKLGQIIKDRLQPIAQEVLDDIANGTIERKAWDALVNNHELTEYELCRVEEMVEQSR